MPRRWRNQSGIEQVVYLDSTCKRGTPIPAGAVIEAADPLQERILSTIAEKGILEEVPSTPDVSAVHVTLGPWQTYDIRPVPHFRNMSRREFVIHDAQGNIVADLLPGAEVIGFEFMQLERPAGPLRWLNKRAGGWATPLVETLTTERKENS